MIVENQTEGRTMRFQKVMLCAALAATALLFAGAADA